jgi:hypothetical protein
MQRFYYPSLAVNHLEELSILAGIRANMKPNEALIILPSGRVPYILPAAQDEGFTFNIPKQFFDGRYFYFYGHRFTFEQLEQLSLSPPRFNNYNHQIISNATPSHADARTYFLTLNHTSTSKEVLKILRSYTRPNNQLVDFDIHLLPSDLITVVWKTESVKEMEDILYLVQNSNVYFLLLNPAKEIEEFLLIHKKRFHSYNNQIKFIADYHALFCSKVVLSLEEKILQYLGFNLIKRDGYFFSIQNYPKYSL